MFIGLNPSTADETNDDPTVRRCINYARDWGYNGLCMTNLFAYRATDPREMMAVDDPVGWENDDTLWRVAVEAGIVVCAWGNHGKHQNRSYEVLALLRVSHGIPVHILRLNKGVWPEPAHPLYLPRNLKPTKWQ